MSVDQTQYDWQTKIRVVIRYPSSVSGTVGPDVVLVGVEDFSMNDDQPVDFVSFLNEQNAAAVDKIPVYGGTVRIAETSADVLKLRNLLLNRLYFDIVIMRATTADGNDKMNWQPEAEIFQGCRFTGSRVTISPGVLPMREFTFKARYRNYNVGGLAASAALGDGWTIHDKDTTLD